VNIFGYKIFFYSNEQGEPPHVHVGKSQKNTSKIWLEPLSLAHNKSQIPVKDLRKIVRWLETHRTEVLKLWQNYFSNRI